LWKSVDDKRLVGKANWVPKCNWANDEVSSVTKSVLIEEDHGGRGGFSMAACFLSWTFFGFA
jgi:hypothetical protein